MLGSSGCQISLFHAVCYTKDKYSRCSHFSMYKNYNWRDTISEIIISCIYTCSIRKIIIFLVINALNYFIIYAHYCMPFRKELELNAILCTYSKKKLKSFCFLIPSFMGYLLPVYVCNNILYLSWMSSVHFSWLHWSVMSWTCGIQGLLDY